MSSTKRLAHQVSATPPSPHTSVLDDASRRSSFSLSSSDATSSASTVTAALPTDVPRTTEVLWNGTASLGFTLKRKRKTGAILVSKLLPSCSSRLRVGSELKLVSGFPIKQLTLDEVKKVMLYAPKPVSLVFLNSDDVVAATPTPTHTSPIQKTQKPQLVECVSSSFATVSSDDCGSFDNDLDAAASTLVTVPEPTSVRAAAAFFDMAPAAAFQRPLHRTVSDFTLTMPPVRAPLSPSTMSASSEYTTFSSYYYAKPSASHAKKRKVSKLRVALDRMSQLLNRPVRQSALNIPANKSIVV